ncbi:trypsin-like peptidase domain-containing protein [Shewanella sp. 202IG2-18]|uniref:AVAST type 1 anti-phage system protease Avs1b n=1 Tax=Parashewanella hymeniacidonis TaxID=2807618 RepID=UPI00195FF4D8|nr:AVAST type 1 anti-phage system protease Avs1b [Parashewanella hymeniacidonis]MBM7072755.1 trypsin-like peptidase domain-containing protein [Parashewanella hymeniacidonis]
MLDAEVRTATCRIECGEDTGTAWLVAPDKVLTARHCVLDAFVADDDIDESVPITLAFIFSSPAREIKAKIIDHDIDLDICLLSIEIQSEVTPIILSDQLPICGSTFYSYGCPINKLTIGHRLEGTIAQVLDTPKLGIDVEIHIDTSAALANYEGFSGSALICDGSCFGLLRVSVDNTVGVISISRQADFLRKNGVLPEHTEIVDKRVEELASREEFIREFDTFVSSKSGGYIFIEGAHGIGKSTFCEAYTPIDSSLEHFDTYSFTSRNNAVNAVQLAQPQEFYNWFNMQVSMFICRTPGRIDNKDYPHLLKETERHLVRLGEEYSSRGKVGLLFIDGIDEIAKHDETLLSHFIGLFPQQLPLGLAIVFSAPSYMKLATQLGVRLRRDTCISMPLLTYDVTRDFCRQALTENCSNPVTIKLICDRAQGHPLYLRYLIDLVNSGKLNDELAELPQIEGSIRNYYESLWNQLQSDMEAVNLLAIMVRLRWGVTIELLTEILNQGEQAVLVGTIERIQHLLLEPCKTTIYHSSFCDFLTEKTQLRERDIQSRLSAYCLGNRNNNYGLLNVIHHGLKAEETDKAYIISLCDQRWVDECVIEGIEPDILLGDLNKVLAAATDLGSLIETVRILLLSQRLQFRYNTLFSQSAELIASALLSIGMTHDVLQHVIRYGQLIIPIHQALRVAFQLIKSDNNKDALELLSIIETSLDEQLSTKGGLLIQDLLKLYDLQVQQFILKSSAGDNKAARQLQQFQLSLMRTIIDGIQDEAASKFVQREMMIYQLAANMCLISQYIPVSLIRQHYSGPLEELVEPLIYTVSYYKSLCDDYRVVPEQSLLELVSTDLKTLVPDFWDDSKEVNPSTVDSLITLGTPPSVIRVICSEHVDVRKKASVQFIAKDNVSIDESSMQDGMAHWRYVSYIDSECLCPNLVSLSPSNWRDGIDNLCRNIAWCDGSARRFKDSADATGLGAVWDVLQQNVFEQLRFSLAQRVQWEDAYGLPEAVFPHIYQYLATLIVDVFPENICNLLTFIEEQFTYQCGVYSEGFRDILSNVLTDVTNTSLEESVEDQVFLLMERWREFVVSNLKNRYEIVPELLTIIPLFTRLNASEEAKKTYQLVLAFSMGPSWYKEDQFGLNVTALESLNHELSLESGALSQIAGLLDAAGGEMTFQRFVRYAKRDFIGALCLRGDFANAVDYFIRQTYGTLEQMYQEATQGDIDRVSELRGTRFPGGALDEQDSILCIIKSAIPNADWQLCWTLLESYQFGDSRHLSNYAEAYGLLIKKGEEDSEALTMMMKRLEIICESELENAQCFEFLSSIKLYLPDGLKQQFENRFGVYFNLSQASKETIQHSKVSSVEQAWKGDSNKEKDLDSLHLPGTFGTSCSMAEAEAAFSKADRHLRRRNKSEAQREVISGLEAIQCGGWPIWTGDTARLSHGHSRLFQTTSSVSDLVKLYSPLILNERYSESWRIAESLIGLLANSSSNDEQAALLRSAIDHTILMVGNAQEEINSYKLLEEERDTDLSSCLVKLILHTIDHPTWIRSEKAADMLLWLLRSDLKFIHLFGAKAFSMDSGNHPDVICGVLEQLSYSEPKLWDLLYSGLDFDAIVQECKHVGRLSVLVRITEQAAEREFAGASEALTIFQDSFGKKVDLSQEKNVDCPAWAQSSEEQWSRLKQIGLVNSDLVEQATSIMEGLCSPIPLETSLEIEQLLAEGASGNINQPTRWSTKVRFAIQVALQPVVNKEQISKVEEVFRTYNPTRLDTLRTIRFTSPAFNWLKTQDPKPINGRDIYLDYCERVWFEGSLKLIRLTAYISDGSKFFPVQSGRFLSTDKPALDSTSYKDVCANVIALPVYFGSFTPAIPTSRFMSLLGNNNPNLKRAWWRSGRLTERYSGAPKNEGCYLSIDKEALRLPHGLNLVWVYEVDFEPIALIYNN